MIARPLLQHLSSGSSPVGNLVMIVFYLTPYLLYVCFQKVQCVYTIPTFDPLWLKPGESASGYYIRSFFYWQKQHVSAVISLASAGQTTVDRPGKLLPQQGPGDGWRDPTSANIQYVQYNRYKVFVMDIIINCS